MEKHSFYFKQFAVRHDKCSMKVGTDGVLLGAWTSVSGAKRILEIGTGSGVIALMLAQRTTNDVLIDAVEIAEENANQAAENVKQSPWPDKIKVIHTPVQQFDPHLKYDLIVSNPPFFVNSTSPPSKARLQSRHADQLSHDELLQNVRRLLAADGKFCVILPAAEGDLFQVKAIEHDLHCAARTAFYSRVNKSQERWLLEFAMTPIPQRNDTSLVLYDTGERWSENYHDLMREFYLKDR